MLLDSPGPTGSSMDGMALVSRMGVLLTASAACSGHVWVIGCMEVRLPSIWIGFGFQVCTLWVYPVGGFYVGWMFSDGLSSITE